MTTRAFDAGYWAAVGAWVSGSDAWWQPLAVGLVIWALVATFGPNRGRYRGPDHPKAPTPEQIPAAPRTANRGTGSGPGTPPPPGFVR